MRTYRKREWSSLTVNMVPLINVIFLITIFIVMMINFSEVILKKVNLPKADEAREVKEQIIRKILITVKSEDLIFLGNKRVSLDNLEHMQNGENFNNLHDKPQWDAVLTRLREK